MYNHSQLLGNTWRHCTGRGTNAARGWQYSDRDLWSLSAAATFCSGACSVRTFALLQRTRGVAALDSGCPLCLGPSEIPNGSASVSI